MSIDVAFDHLPDLTTERLKLRPLRSGDAAAMYAIKSDAEVTTTYGQEPHDTLRATEAWLERLQQGYRRREVLVWHLTLRGADIAIGSCMFWNPGPGWLCAELGYELGRAYWGGGIMGEALRAVLDCGFGGLGLHRVEACPLASNAGSTHLLRKLGFTYEGLLRQRHFFRGQYHDQLYFGVLNSEWENKHKSVE